MQIRLHKNARTTPAVRQAIQASTLSERALAQKYGVSRTTIRKWKHRSSVEDASHRPHTLKTTLTPAQEAIVVYLRQSLLLPLDDLLAVTREFLNPDVSRSGLNRCLRRHGVASLKALLPPVEKTKYKPFKAYEPGFLHVDVKYLPAIEGEPRRYLFVAIDRATRWVYVALKPNRSALSAKAFLKEVIQAAPFRIQKCLTDNGSEFTDRFLTRTRQPSGTHEFDRLCAEQAIEHRLIPPGRPQTNGLVERFNGRIEEVLQTHRFDSTADLETTLHRYVDLYNHHIPQRALGHLTPIQALKNWQMSHPHLFRKKVHNLAELDIYLLPLFVLALSHDLLASEKEAGILGLLAAQPVSLRRLLSFKIGFRLGLLLLLTAGLLLIAVAVAGIDPRQPGVGWRLVSWFGIVFAYCGFWFALAMLVVSLGWRSATNAAVLAASWLTVVILVPAGVNMFLAAAYPMPNRMDYIVRLRDAADDIRKATDEIAEGFFADHPELRPDAESADDESKWVLGQLELDRRMQAAVAEFTDALQHQQDLAERLKFFSPALLTQSAFLELTGTGLARHRQFLAQIDAYHAELRDFFNPKLIRGDFAFDAFDDIPRFEYREESAGDLAGRVGTDLLGLAAPALLMGWLASIAVRRYRVAGS